MREYSSYWKQYRSRYPYQGNKRTSHRRHMPLLSLLRLWTNGASPRHKWPAILSPHGECSSYHALSAQQTTEMLRQGHKQLQQILFSQGSRRKHGRCTQISHQHMGRIHMEPGKLSTALLQTAIVKARFHLKQPLRKPKDVHVKQNSVHRKLLFTAPHYGVLSPSSDVNRSRLVVHPKRMLKLARTGMSTCEFTKDRNKTLK